jgi:hypothetical protein
MQKTPDNQLETSVTTGDDDDDENNYDEAGQLGTLAEGSDDDSDDGSGPVLPIHGNAVWPWNDTNDAESLVFQKDDRIYMMEYNDENCQWVRGRNEKTRLIGVFPCNYVKVDPPDYATALREVEFDKKKKDRLDFRTNDRILLLRYDSSSWDIGQNLRTGREGKYPYSYVKMDRGRFAIAQFDYPYDEEKPEQLVFHAKDRILVTKYVDAVSWARGRNERTRFEGNFPASYVKFPE